MIQRQPGKVSVRSRWNRIISKNCFDVVAKEVNYFCLFLFILFSLRWLFFSQFLFSIESQRKNPCLLCFCPKPVPVRNQIFPPNFHLLLYIMKSVFFFCIYCLYICSPVFHFKKSCFPSSISFLYYSLTLKSILCEWLNDFLFSYLISFTLSPNLYFVITIIYSNQHRFYFLYHYFVIICGLLKFFFLPYVRNVLAYLKLQIYQVNFDLLSSFYFRFKSKYRHYLICIVDIQPRSVNITRCFVSISVS